MIYSHLLPPFLFSYYLLVIIMYFFVYCCYLYLPLYIVILTCICLFCVYNISYLSFGLSLPFLKSNHCFDLLLPPCPVFRSHC